MSVLDQSLRARIQSGVLPTSIAGARFGRGRGGRCAVCRLAIRLPDTEVEVEVFHRACFNLWRAEVARLRAQEA